MLVCLNQLEYLRMKVLEKVVLMWWSRVKLSERDCKIGICHFRFQVPSFDLVVIGLGGGMLYVFWFFIEVVVLEVVGKLVVVVVLDDLFLVVP